MNTDDDPSLPAHLSDEAAAQMTELLYEIARALENRDAGQIMRYYRNIDPRQADRWDWL